MSFNLVIERLFVSSERISHRLVHLCPVSISLSRGFSFQGHDDKACEQHRKAFQSRYREVFRGKCTIIHENNSTLNFTRWMMGCQTFCSCLNGDLGIGEQWVEDWKIGRVDGGTVVCLNRGNYGGRGS